MIKKIWNLNYSRVLWWIAILASISIISYVSNFNIEIPNSLKSVLTFTPFTLIHSSIWSDTNMLHFYESQLCVRKPIWEQSLLALTLLLNSFLIFLYLFGQKRR